MFPLIFCSLCAQKFWCVHPFLEMTNEKKGLHLEVKQFFYPNSVDGQKKKSSAEILGDFLFKFR